MTITSRTRRLSTLAVGGSALALTLAACGGGSSGGSADQVTPQSQGSNGAAAVMAHSGPLGSYLTDSSGRTLYIFGADTSSKSTCTGDCASEWPPFTTTGSPTAKAGAESAMLSTSTRDDGTTQVTYAGHPLYYFDEDESAGDIKGEGQRDFGGLWTAVSPTGSAVTQSGSSGGSSSPTESSNGWG